MKEKVIFRHLQKKIPLKITICLFYISENAFAKYLYLYKQNADARKDYATTATRNSLLIVG